MKRRIVLFSFVCAIAASEIGRAGVLVTTSSGVVDTRRPIARLTAVGQVDTRPLGITIIIR